MRHTVFKYKFNYKTEHGTHGPCTLEFIVSSDGKLPKEGLIEAKAMGIVDDIGTKLPVTTGQLPMYDFGELSKDEMLDDIRKLTKIEFKAFSVQLWFDRDERFAFWDDGQAPECECITVPK